MSHQHMEVSAFGPLVLMWWLMMGLMMLPVTLPWFRTLRRLDGGSGALVRFGAGYFGVWLGFSFGAALLQTGLARTGLFERGAATPAIGAALLVLAGLYQFTPAKTSCLKHCRSPMSFFLNRWEDGPRGTFRLGTEHGLFCVGCCWALMLLGFALGVMNWWWMLLLTGVVMLENLSSRGQGIAKVVGLGLMVLALSGCGEEDGLVCTAEYVYGITIDVIDSGVNAYVPNATGTLTEGSYTETMELLPPGILLGAGERAGTYDIEVRAEGFETWTRTGVVVEANSCHVIGQTIEARLERAG